MGLRDIIKKKDEVQDGGNLPASSAPQPEVVIIRSDTTSQEVVEAPDFSHLSTNTSKEPSSFRRSLDVFRSGGRSRSGSVSSQTDNSKPAADSARPRRLSQRFSLHRGGGDTSENVPDNLPSIPNIGDADGEGSEAQWEDRATKLAGQNEIARTRPVTPTDGKGDRTGSKLSAERMAQMRLETHTGSAPSKPTLERKVSSKEIDEDIQEAIRLHEAGDLVSSTRLFGKLADPNGANNPLSQVLYGLALRHGWGCDPDPAGAVHHLSAAASNAAAVEKLALQAGMRKGGAAKGELVLAIFELANCFRHGWGVSADPVAAKQYYETAANLGDTDAMNEVAWCYLEGYGCKKDKFASARYYQQAEKAGNKTLGNSWIWKDKYKATQ